VWTGIFILFYRCAWRKMEEIKDTLGNIMRALKAKKGEARGKDPQALLEGALSKKELKHVKPGSLKKGVLSINVDSSSWLYQLNLKKAELLSRLSKNTADIREVRFRLGAIK